MTTVSPTTLTIRELVLPQRLDTPDAADFHALVALMNAICRSDTGLSDFDRTAEESLPEWLDSSDDVDRAFLAEEDGRILGAVALHYATAEPTSADIDLMVLPVNWGRGIEQALLDRAESEVRLLDRKVLQSWTLHRPDAAGETLAAPTGWGRVSATPHARILERNGYGLEQVERNSALDLQGPMDSIRTHLDAALAIAGDDYRLVQWTVPTPAEHREGYAWAMSRMSTDAPSGGLEVDEEVWDADRLARREARFLESGQTVSVAAAVHVPTGAFAALNELVIGDDPTGVTHQYSTLVLKEHRGHRLGMIVKCANILRWKDIAPDSPRISTFNAEENRPMLSINEALGFTAVSYAAAWQKKLS
ncbi:GNAT family N-acetyltransferase [Microbacterium sp. H1-D42]|uniref:GNAT family N-acetyltransferase n=1 Tax=Microbacterium sp. H1-D42 TaxID=2925844 RepID=UPI001F53D497|nr:GNAT family N-acetyltransferase [Microbacterium sp. H1-D42]UNK69397.1 GNAT family N-acetyltransferase [Microbacterium sp. H1-D42]